MSFIGFNPYTDLGRAFTDDENPSAQEALEAAGMDWSVRLEPAYTADGTDTGFYALRREDSGDVLSVVGKRYAPLQNIDAAGFFQNVLTQGDAKIIQALSLNGGRKIVLIAKLREVGSVLPQDRVGSHVVLAHSHDGTLAIQAGLTNFRFVCFNQLSMLRKQTANFKHTASAAAKLRAVGSMIDAAHGTFAATVEQYRFLAERKVVSEKDLARFVRVVHSGGDKSVMDSEEAAKRLLPKIQERYEAGTGMDIPGVRGTWWAAYNAVTEYLTHDSGRSADTRAASNLFGVNANTNSTALAVATEFAEGIAA